MITAAMVVAGLAALAALGAVGMARAGPRLVLPLGRFTFPRVKVKPSAQVAPGVEWLDDYFTVQRIDADTLAIGEPRYFQQNHAYLILGRERALLFDTGAGPRDIAPAVGALTALRVTATCSHLHYDHSANLHRFPEVRFLDVPALRAAVRSGGGEVLVPPPELHLGALERVPAPEIRVSGWIAPGSTLDLGGRRLTSLHAPGHTPDGMVLLDRERNLLFAGDLLYPLGAYAFGPGADVHGNRWR
jgi:hydroxyacylglutathione hydrolase